MSKEKYTIEYDMKTAPIMLLWNHIATPSGLSQWFADKVTQHGKSLIFNWGGNETCAHIVGTRYGTYMRYRWTDDTDDTRIYFEMKISVSEITSTTTLTIIDFADDKSDEESSRELWNYQVGNLRRILGCL